MVPVWTVLPASRFSGRHAPVPIKPNDTSSGAKICAPLRVMYPLVSAAGRKTSRSIGALPICPLTCACARAETPAARVRVSRVRPIAVCRAFMFFSVEWGAEEACARTSKIEQAIYISAPIERKADHTRIGRMNRRPARRGFISARTETESLCQNIGELLDNTSPNRARKRTHEKPELHVHVNAVVADVERGKQAFALHHQPIPAVPVALGGKIAGQLFRNAINSQASFVTGQTMSDIDFKLVHSRQLSMEQLKSRHRYLRVVRTSQGLWAAASSSISYGHATRFRRSTCRPRQEEGQRRVFRSIQPRCNRGQHRRTACHRWPPGQARLGDGSDRSRLRAPAGRENPNSERHSGPSGAGHAARSRGHAHVLSVSARG